MSLSAGMEEEAITFVCKAFSLLKWYEWKLLTCQTSEVCKINKSLGTYARKVKITNL